jgi:hypothetical protein
MPIKTRFFRPPKQLAIPTKKELIRYPVEKRRRDAVTAIAINRSTSLICHVDLDPSHSIA